MKRHILDFFRRGMFACGFGPIILAVLYLLLQQKGLAESFTVNEICTGIFSISALAFIAGGMNSIYQIERLPLMAAVLIHGTVLYISYLLTYLVNGWLEWGTTPFLVFSAIFLVGYLAIWALIYFVIKQKTKKINKSLKQKQQSATDN